MKDVIPFPYARIKRIKAKPERLENIPEKLIIGVFDITCSKCNKTNSFNPNGIIFKQLEYYCSSCGAHHKVSNPALSQGKR